MLTNENNLSLAHELSLVLTNESQIRYQVEQLIQIRNKIKEQYDVSADSIFTISYFYILNCLYS